MPNLNQTAFLITLSLGCAANSLHAQQLPSRQLRLQLPPVEQPALQQIRQPTSILPWRALRPTAQLAFNTPEPRRLPAAVTKDQVAAPRSSSSSNFDEPQELVQRKPIRHDLPMVEQESYANLGQMNLSLRQSTGILPKAMPKKSMKP